MLAVDVGRERIDRIVRRRIAPDIQLDDAGRARRPQRTLSPLPLAGEGRVRAI